MALKIIHTGDWHLGKKLYRKERFDEHQLFLDWLLEKIKELQADILIISGDIFDTPNPPHRSLRQFYHFLDQAVKDTQVSIYAIGGNHDSGQLLEATNPLMEKERVHIVGPFHYQQIDQHFFTYKKNDIQLSLCLFPFFRTIDFERLSIEANQNNTGPGDSEQILSAIETFFQAYQQYHQQHKNDYSLLVAHHLFGSFMPSGSEQGLNLSGLESIPLSSLKNYFDYVALGHIHRPQILKSANPIAIYPGSPLPMRFSEVSETSSKEVRLVTIEKAEKDKAIEHSSIPVPFFRPLLQYEGHYNCDEGEDFEDSPFIKGLVKKIETLLPVILESPVRPAWLECKLWLQRPQGELYERTMEALRKNFGKVASQIECVQFQSLFKSTGPDQLEREADGPESSYAHSITTEELFERFYQQKYPQQANPPREVIEDFNEALNLIRQTQGNALPGDERENWLFDH